MGLQLLAVDVLSAPVEEQWVVAIGLVVAGDVLGGVSELPQLLLLWRQLCILSTWQTLC